MLPQARGMQSWCAELLGHYVPLCGNHVYNRQFWGDQEVCCRCQSNAYFGPDWWGVRMQVLTPLQSVCAFVTSFPYNPDFVALTDLIAAQDAASGELDSLFSIATVLCLPKLTMSALQCMQGHTTRACRLP